MTELQNRIPGLEIVVMKKSNTTKSSKITTSPSKKKGPRKGKGRKNGRRKNNHKGKPTPPNPKWDIGNIEAIVASPHKQTKEVLFKPSKEVLFKPLDPPTTTEPALTEQQLVAYEVYLLFAKGETLLRKGLLAEGLNSFKLALEKLDPQDPLYQTIEKAVEEVTSIISKTLSNKK